MSNAAKKLPVFEVVNGDSEAAGENLVAATLEYINGYLDRHGVEDHGIDNTKKEATAVEREERNGTRQPTAKAGRFPGRNRKGNRKEGSASGRRDNAGKSA